MTLAYGNPVVRFSVKLIPPFLLPPGQCCIWIYNGGVYPTASAEPGTGNWHLCRRHSACDISQTKYNVTDSRTDRFNSIRLRSPTAELDNYSMAQLLHVNTKSRFYHSKNNVFLVVWPEQFREGWSANLYPIPLKVPVPD